MAVVSFGFEALRDEVEGRKEAERGPRIVGTILVLAVFELFLMGVHATTTLLSSGNLKEVNDVVLGHALAAEGQGQGHLLIMVLLWVVVAVVLTSGLCFAVFDPRCELPAMASWRDLPRGFRPTGRAALIGALTGGVVGPLAVLGYTFLMRAGAEVNLILRRPGDFETHLRGLADYLGWWGGLLRVLASLLGWMTGTFGPLWGPLLTIAISVAAAVVSVEIAVRAGDGRWALPAAIIVVAYLVPLFAESAPLAKLALAVAVVWALPGVVLGAMVPWLSKPSEHPRIWGLVGLLAAAILLLSSIPAWSEHRAVAYSLAGVALVLMVAGMVVGLFRRPRAIDRYWPVLALSVAINVFGVNRLALGADFFNIQKEAYFLRASAPLTLRPSESPFARFTSTTDFMRWSTPPSLAWPTVPPMSGIRGDVLFLSPAVVQARHAMKARTDAIAAARQALAGRTEALSRSVKAADDEFKTSGRLSLAAQEKALVALETKTRNLLEPIESLDREATGYLNGDLVRPLPEETATPSGLGDASQRVLSSEVQAFTKVRTAFLDKLDELRKALATDRANVDRLLIELRTVQKEIKHRIEASIWLELSMTGSLGFWATIGTLAGWSIRNHARATPTGDEHDHR